MDFKTKLDAFFTALQDNLNDNLTNKIKAFKFGYFDFSQLPEISLLFLTSKATVNQETHNTWVNTIPGSLIIQIKKSLTLYSDLLLMIQEVSNFIIDNPHLGGVINTYPTNWEIDTDNTLSTGILAIDIEIQI